MVTAKWRALAREAGLSAEQMAIGATAISRADHSQSAYYYQLLFSLSIGFERAAKLAIVVEHMVEHGSKVPTQQQLKNHGHNLRTLLDATDQIAVRRGPASGRGRLPRTPIHDSIVEVLTEF